jgi:DNA-binding protein HU-beta
VIRQQRREAMADEKIVTIALTKIAADLAEKHEMSKKASAAILADFVEITVKHLKKGAKVRITGLGIFQVKKRPARLGRNPLTGEQIKIKASKKLAFRAAKEVKESI